MKNSIKKYLMLVLVIITLFVTTVCVSYASTDSSLPATINCSSEECKGTPQKPMYGNKVEAQCESDGYTNIICSKCKTVWGTDNHVAALGHLYAVKDYTLDESGKYYQCNLRCTREDCQYGMDPQNLKPEVDEDFNEIKYCQVNFINNFVAAKFETPAFCSYAKLAAVDEADAYTTQTETLYVKYPTGDEDDTYVYAEGTPYRMADKYYGRYTFKGWLTQGEIDAVYNQAYEGMPATIFTLRHDTNKILVKNRQYDQHYGMYVTPEVDRNYHSSLVSEAETSKPVVTAETPAKYDLYAIFKVDTNVPHSVTFLNYDGTVLYEVSVNHATQIAEYNGRYPERSDNLEYVYEFFRWVLFGTTTPMSNSLDIDSVYADLTVMADYTAIAKTYNLKYFERDGKTPINVAVDTIALVGDDPELTTPINGIAANKLVETYFDESYIYEPTGKWLIPSRGNYIVNLNRVTLPEGTLSSSHDNIEHIVLIPQYQQYTRMYKLVVTILYPDDPNYYYPEEIDVQVKSAEGKVVGWANLDHSEQFYDKKSKTYKITFDVPYSKYYTVAATSNGYKQVEDSNFYGSATPNNPDDDGPVPITLIMKKQEGSTCNCLCHTFFKPVWVGILNLLNSLFKAELVCCDDMFANIGSELNYGPAATK